MQNKKAKVCFNSKETVYSINKLSASDSAGTALS